MADLSQFEEATAAVNTRRTPSARGKKPSPSPPSSTSPTTSSRCTTRRSPAQLEPQVAEMIGERAGGFCDEWFGDDPKVLEKILSRVLQLAPASDSALQRLSRASTPSPSAGPTCSRSTTARSTRRKDKSPPHRACCAKPRSSRRTSRTSPRRRSATTSSCCRSSPTTRRSARASSACSSATSAGPI